LLQKLEKKLLPVKPKIKPPRNEISSRIPSTQPRLQKSENAQKKQNTVSKTEYSVAFLWNFHSGVSVDHSNKNQSRNRRKAITHAEPKKNSQNRNETKCTGYIRCRIRRSPLKINPIFF